MVEIRGEDHTIVCRCEDLTLADIKRAIRDHGIADFNTLKRLARCSMGACQGKNCRPLIMQILAQMSNASPDSLKPDNRRPPTKPISLKALYHHD